MLHGKKVFVFGMARSGFEAAKLLAKDNEVLVTDQKMQNANNIKTLEDLGVKVKITDDALSLLDESFDIMIKNPGIKYNNPVIEKARSLGIEIINEVELAYSYINKKINIIAVTGSNGKTTTVTLIYNILKEAGYSTHLGGNVGTPLSKLVNDLKDEDFLVLEISDHQLCDMYKFKANVSVLTNIYEAHTDFHDSHKRYVDTKKKIFNNMTKDDIAITNYDNKEALDIANKIDIKTLFFSKTSKQNVYLLDDAIYYHDEKIIDIKDIKIKGEHNLENIMAAISVVKLYNVENEYIVNVLKNFNGVEHRIEYVDTINDVKYYNDSKATNCESTKTALNAFSEPTLLILGGLDRGHSFDDLTKAMKNVIYVATFGETKNRINEYCKKIRIKCDVFENLKEATISCIKKAQKGNIVLLSPACASWDQYECFEDRGNEFKDIIKNFKNN